MHRLYSLARRCVRAIALIAAVGCGACAPSDDRGDFRLEWQGSDSALAMQVWEEGWFQDYVDLLNQRFKLPYDLTIVHKSCGLNAYYYPNLRTLFMCYEMLDEIGVPREGEPLAQRDARVRATWTFFFFHELGHALIDYYDLPVPGREEDAVDGFASVLLIETQLADEVLLAADHWNQLGAESHGRSAFADEHSLDLQRFFNIQCLVYGSDPSKYDSLVRNGELPADRAQRCPGEYDQALRAWRTLLEPWIKS